MEARLISLDREQLDQLREKVTVKPGVVIYRKPPWLHALWGEGITEEELKLHGTEGPSRDKAHALARKAAREKCLTVLTPDG